MVINVTGAAVHTRVKGISYNRGLDGKIVSKIISTCCLVFFFYVLSISTNQRSKLGLMYISLVLVLALLKVNLEATR